MKQTRIQPYQGAFLSILLCFGCLGAVSPIGSALGHAIWLLMIPAAAVGALLFFFYTAVLKQSGARGLTEISLAAFGPRWGKLALIAYVAYFLFVACYYLLAVIDLWMLMDMRRTPLIVYIMLVLLLITLVARLGLATIGRVAGFFAIFYLLMALADTLFVLPEMQWQRILPLQLPAFKSLAADSLYITVMMFGLLPVALIWTPRLGGQKTAKSCLGIGMAAIFGDLLLANLRNIFLFGDALQYEDYPTYQALRLVEWGSGILRLELFGELATLAMVFLFGALLFYGMGSILASVSGKEGAKMLPPLAVTAALIMLYMKSKINFTDNAAVLITLALSSILTLVLLFATILKLQKTDC